MSVLMDTPDLAQMEERLSYQFKDIKHLQIALTHKTYAFEADRPMEFNERMEYLGDSVLSFVTAELLYKKSPYFNEGELTRRRAMLVNNDRLADLAFSLGIGEFLLLGRGELKQKGASNKSNLAGALEAVIAAIYLDSGIQATRRFIKKKIIDISAL